MKYVNQPVRKTDAMSLVTGKPVYTDDLAPKDCLIIKIGSITADGDHGFRLELLGSDQGGHQFG